MLTDNVGNTPIVRLTRSALSSSSIFLKLENLNVGGSIKSRVAIAMVNAAERLGLLRPGSGQTVLEASGGNTAIGLAIICNLRGYRCQFVIPDNYSMFRARILHAYGVQIHFSDHKSGNDSHFRRLAEIHLQHPEYIFLNQLANPENPRVHYEYTASEIFRDFDQDIDYFVSGVGSGGTISGIGRRLKERYPKCKVVAVQPAGCDILKGKSIAHKIQGFAIGLLPETFDTSIVDEVITVSEEEVFTVARDLPRREGLFLGISAAANIHACRILESRVRASNILTVAPDGGCNYEDLFPLLPRQEESSRASN